MNKWPKYQSTVEQKIDSLFTQWNTTQQRKRNTPWMDTTGDSHKDNAEKEYPDIKSKTQWQCLRPGQRYRGRRHRRGSGPLTLFLDHSWYWWKCIHVVKIHWDIHLLACFSVCMVKHFSKFYFDNKTSGAKLRGVRRQRSPLETLIKWSNESRQSVAAWHSAPLDQSEQNHPWNILAKEMEPEFDQAFQESRFMGNIGEKRQG